MIIDSLDSSWNVLYNPTATKHTVIVGPDLSNFHKIYQWKSSLWSLSEISLATCRRKLYLKKRKKEISIIRWTIHYIRCVLLFCSDDYDDIHNTYVMCVCKYLGCDRKSALPHFMNKLWNSAWIETEWEYRIQAKHKRK